MSIEKHPEASIPAVEFDFDRATTASAAGTGQLPTGITIATAVVWILKQVGAAWEDVTAEFIDAADDPVLVDSNKAVQQRLKPAAAGEQLRTRIPYTVKCVAAGSDGETYVLEDDLEIVGTVSPAAP